MAATIRFVALVGLLLFCADCKEARDFKLPPSPTSVTTPVPTFGPLPPPPPLTGPSTTYVFSGRLSYPVRYFTVGSKYVVYENGAVVLAYDEGFQYVGQYRREPERLLFAFPDSGSATGTVRGDLLEVRYDLRMQMSDFEDAVYKRSQ